MGWGERELSIGEREGVGDANGSVVMRVREDEVVMRVREDEGEEFV